MRCKDSEFGVSFHEFVGYSLNMLGNVDKFVVAPVVDFFVYISRHCSPILGKPKAIIIGP